MKKEIGAVLYSEVSAKTRDGLDQLFDKVVDIVLKARAEAEGGVDDDDDGGAIVRGKKKKKACILL